MTLTGSSTRTIQPAQQWQCSDTGAERCLPQ